MGDTLKGTLEEAPAPVHESLKGTINSAQSLHGTLSSVMSLVTAPEYMIATDEDIDTLFLEEE